MNHKIEGLLLTAATLLSACATPPCNSLQPCYGPQIGDIASPGEAVARMQAKADLLTWKSGSPHPAIEALIKITPLVAQGAGFIRFDADQNPISSGKLSSRGY